MTGTGTQADPFVPITLTEFIEAVGTSSAYVALDRDIDAAEDPAYTGELTAPVGFAAAQVEGNGHFVRGVTVRAQNMIALTPISAHVLDLDLIAWAHKKTTQAPTFQGYNSRNYDTGFENCMFSVAVDAPCYGNRLMNHIKMERCSADIKYISTDGAPGYAIDYCTIAYTTLRISGIWIGSVTSNVLLHDVAFPRSAVILHDPRVYDKAYLTYNVGWEYSYIAFVDIPQGITGIQGSNFLATGGVIVAIDDTGIPMTFDSAGAIRATLDQMKDEAWLASVGFLP